MTKTALVTGASSGAGQATALQLLDEGYAVYAGARRMDRMEVLREKGATVLPLDLVDDDSMSAFVQQVVDDHGRVDVLVNVAGYGLCGALEDVPIDSARRQLEVNVLAQVRLIQLVLPHMRRQKSGRIVNMSSALGKAYLPMVGWYSATRHCVEVISDVLRNEVEPFGIRVIVIEPGAVQSEFLGLAEESLRQHSEHTAYDDMARAASHILLKANKPPLASPPEQVAKTISKALRSGRPRTRYVVGAMIRLPLFLLRILPDRAIERMIRWQLGRMGLLEPHQAGQ